VKTLFLDLPKDPHPNPSPRGRGAKKNTLLLPLYLWERGLGGEGSSNCKMQEASL